MLQFDVIMLKALVGGRERGPYSMLTIRKVVTPIRYDKSASISAIRKVEALKRVMSNALKRVTIRKVDLFYAPFAMQ